MILILLYACSKNEDNQPDISDDIVQSTDGSYDSDVLYWAIPGVVNPGLMFDDQWQMSFDEALRQRGADFTVRFLPLGNLFGYARADEEGLWYYDRVIEMMSGGGQVDIAFIGDGTHNIDAYMKAYLAGVTTPLDDFLKSDEGRVIYGFFPSIVWDAMKIDGEIYGFPAAMSLGKEYGYLIKNEWLNTHPINTSLLTNRISSLIPLISDDSDTWVGGFDIASMSNMYRITSCIVLHNGIAHSLYEHELFFDFLSSYRVLHEMGLTETDNQNKLNEGPDISWSGAVFPEIYEQIGDLWTSYPVSTPDLSSEKSAVIINVNSPNREKVMQLFTWLYEDPALADMLIYGVENLHYEHKNGVAYFINDTPIVDYEMASFAGVFYIATPPQDTFTPLMNYFENTPERAIIFLRTLSSAPYTGFRFNVKGYEEVLIRLDEIVKEYTDASMATNYRLPDFLRGADPDWEHMLTVFNAELRAAGIGTIIDEVNRQYEMWRELHAPVR
jgi:hypothetical protein